MQAAAATEKFVAIKGERDEALLAAEEAREVPTSCIQHPKPYTLHISPYTLHSTLYTLNLTPYTLHPTPYTLTPNPEKRNTKSQALSPQP